MSGSKSKSKQTETSTGTATTTPNTPEWLAAPWQQNIGSVAALANSGQPLIPGASALQQQAFAGASALGGGGPVSMGGGAMAGSPAKYDPTNPQTIPTAGGAASTSSNPFDIAATLGLSGSQGIKSSRASNRDLTDVDLDGYFNPFEQRVIDTTLADYDQNSGRIEAAQRGQQSLNGGLRNSNNAIAQSLTQGELSRGRASTDAGLRYAGYNTATGLAQNDLARETQNNQYNAGLSQQASMANQQALLQAAGIFTGLGTAQGANDRANIGLQADLGGQQRDIATSQSEAANLALIQSLLNGAPLPAFVGQTQNTTGTGTRTGSQSQISGGVSDVAKLMAMFSDRRLKADIVPTRKDGAGRQWYDYRYLWDAPEVRRSGVMAQEIQRTDPRAVGSRDGFLTVNYAMLGGV